MAEIATGRGGGDRAGATGWGSDDVSLVNYASG